MKEGKNNKDYVLNIRVSHAEYRKVHNGFGKSGHRKLSHYVRETLLKGPVHVTYHDQSTDDMMTVLVQLRKQISGVLNNYNQMMGKLRVLKEVPEFQGKLLIYETDRRSLIKHAEEINAEISKMAAQWLQ